MKSNWIRQPVYDVIATLKGSSDADQWVVRGNHHDGWVFGAFDPLAGTVALLGEAKAMGTLYQQGWRPKRSIVYASWDGEEPMLLGSTEWAETHAKELQRKAVLYLNSDTNGRGFLFAGGSPSLQHLVNQAAANVTDPETRVSVQQRRRARLDVEAAGADASPMLKEDAKLAGKTGDIPLSPLGSGSDFSAFVDHLGIATLNIGFGGEANQGGVYHSRYDSFDHFIRFGDPTFDYEVALAEVAGRIVMRSADAEVLPMRFGDFSSTLDRYVAQLHQEAKHAREAADAQHALFAAGAYKLASDPLHPLAPPAMLTEVPQINFAPLDTAARKLNASAAAYEQAYSARAAAGLDIPAAELQQVNELMGTLAQRLLYAEGLPGRAWYKNLLEAPGALTGYGAKTLPAVHEALDAHDWERADKYTTVTAQVLDAYRAQLDRLTALMTTTH